MAWAEHALQRDPKTAIAYLEKIPEAYHDDWMFLFLRAQAAALAGATEDTLADVARARVVARERWLPLHTQTLVDVGLKID